MTYRFVQSCPTCGRKLEIRVDLLGRAVACQHCQAEFVAADPSSKHSILDVSPRFQADPSFIPWRRLRLRNGF